LINNYQVEIEMSNNKPSEANIKINENLSVNMNLGGVIEEAKE